jgi:acetyl esterase/lipase
LPSAEAQSLIDTYLQYRLGPDAPSRTAEELRAMTEQALAAQGRAEGVRISEVEIGGRRAERTQPAGVEPERVVVYIHGGGYVCGSVSLQRVFLAELATRTLADIYAVDYRLAPEHPYPAAVDDVVAVYEAVLGLAQGRPVLVGGDSAGGGLTVGMMLELRDRHQPLPTAAFAVSPWADMTLTNDVLSSHTDRDIMVRLADLEMMRRSYLGDADPVTPVASPALADLSGLPPLLVQVGGEELLLGDARLLVDRARQCGVEAELEAAEGMFHTWPVIAPWLPESRDAIESLSMFVNRAGS